MLIQTEIELNKQLNEIITDYAFTVELTEEHLTVELLCEDGLFPNSTDLDLIRNFLSCKGFTCSNIKNYICAGELISELNFYY